MTADDLYPYLPYDPTDQQAGVAEALMRYLSTANGADPHVFMLNGYAGTGKTSLVGALVRLLRDSRVPVVLMSPTGRAAKVFSAMAGGGATTIHRRIYRMPAPGEDASVQLAPSPPDPMVVIVDEASMIGDDATEGRPSLLEDLLTWTFGQGFPGNKLILMGDTAQLPPVGLPDSPALSVSRLKSYGMRVTRALMTATVRQASDSGILHNATLLRKGLQCIGALGPGRALPQPRFVVTGHADDVRPVENYDLVDELATAVARDGIEQTLLVTRANWSAVAANITIRNLVLGYEEELVRGERLMVAKNNYLWSSRTGGRLDFIANGETVTVERIHQTETLAGVRFADVTLCFPDRDLSLDCKIVLDALTSNSPALDPALWRDIRLERLRRLVAEREGVDAHFSAALDWSTVPAWYRRELKKDPYVNALQVKYGYAVTCHKAQGGQWANVFVDLSGAETPFQPANATGPAQSPVDAAREQYRWLYTAFTRATRRLYLVNAPESLLR